jgi:hypothetical protein
MQIEQPFKPLASVSGLPVQLYVTRFQQHMQKGSDSIVQQIEQMVGSCSQTQKKEMAASYSTSYYGFPLSFHPFCLARLGAQLEGVFYCYSSSWAAILALPVYLAALLESVLGIETHSISFNLYELGLKQTCSKREFNPL